MNHLKPESEHEELAKAHETIIRQATQIKKLRQQLEREQFALELRQLLTGVVTTNIILSPITHARLLEMVVEIATQAITAEAGTLFLMDEETQDLIFEVAVGPVAQAVKRFRVPLGHGIAGLVAMSGQPIAVANAGQDTRLAYNIAQAVNYIPENILCVPLFYGDRIIGALELLNKVDATSFSQSDMDLLGLFANQAAIAIAQSQAYHDQQTVLNELIRSFVDIHAEHKQHLYQQGLAFSNWMKTQDTVHARARELALLVHELLSQSEQESEICANILRNLVTSLRLRQGIDGFSMVRSPQGAGLS